MTIGFANNRGIDTSYTSRAGWGADETWRFTTRSEYQRSMQNQKNDPDGDKELTESEKKNKTATDYVLQHFKDIFTINRIVSHEGNKQLLRPLQYVNKKSEILIHHTATNGVLPQTVEEEKVFMQNTYKYHAFTRGWGDIGYNFIIMPSGRIYEGRAGGAGVVAAHATWNNTPSIGIAIVGNFENTQPTTQQLAAVTSLSASLAQKYSINPAQKTYYFRASTAFPYIKIESHNAIAGHQDAGNTACPGDYLYDKLPTIRKQVLALLGNTSSTNSAIASSTINASVSKTKRTIIPLAPITNTVALKKIYAQQHSFTASTSSIKRLTGAPQIKKASTLAKGLVRVLLYEASMLKSWNIRCDTTCIVRISNKVIHADRITVKNIDNQFAVTIYDITYISPKFAITAEGDGVVGIVNFDRKSSSGLPLNIFRQSLLFTYGQIKTVDGVLQSQQHIINIVSFDNYMRGIAEASDEQTQTKANVLAYLSKGYAMYYMGGTINHPSIPQDALFTAIDDPRLFQKYLGAGWEKMSKKWPIALQQTKGQYVVYNNLLPILPYFHCSAGFTRSAKEKWGWTDTPYLQTVSDSQGTCASGTFEGHGVGLAGDGASSMASQGKTEKEIIQYYYPGVDIIKIQ